MRDEGVAAPGLVAVAALIVVALGGISVDLWRVIDRHQRNAQNQR